MIGTLAYFGILTPGKVLPGRCNFGVEFQCLDYKIDTTGNTFKLRLKNGVGEVVSITDINLSSEGTTKYACAYPGWDIAANNPPGWPTSWNTSQVIDVSWTACNSEVAGFSVGDKGKVLVTISYYKASGGASYGKQVKGEIYTTVT